MNIIVIFSMVRQHKLFTFSKYNFLSFFCNNKLYLNYYMPHLHILCPRAFLILLLDSAAIILSHVFWYKMSKDEASMACNLSSITEERLKLKPNTKWFGIKPLLFCNVFLASIAQVGATLGTQLCFVEYFCQYLVMLFHKAITELPAVVKVFTVSFFYTVPCIFH